MVVCCAIDEHAGAGEHSVASTREGAERCGDAGFVGYEARLRRRGRGFLAQNVWQCVASAGLAAGDAERCHAERHGEEDERVAGDDGRQRADDRRGRRGDWMPRVVIIRRRAGGGGRPRSLTSRSARWSRSVASALSYGSAMVCSARAIAASRMFLSALAVAARSAASVPSSARLSRLSCGPWRAQAAVRCARHARRFVRTQPG